MVLFNEAFASPVHSHKTLYLWNIAILAIIVMAQNSGIEWTGSTWNPVTGCVKISAGCKYCYAERMARRLQAMGQPNYVAGFRPALHEHMLELPLKWKKPQTIFVNSMSDFF